MSNYDVALDLLIQQGKINKTSDLWLKDHDGWTIAHTAAAHGKLPSNFEAWDLTDNNNKTVAEIAAEMGTLPVEFLHWDRFCFNGDTLAHVAARNGKLPSKLMDSRRIMALCNSRGESVEQIIRQRGAARLASLKSMLAAK